ncbi:MAG: hypothetical protein FJ125_02595 [Deltaproteobacteria bacterium]|nr:hypothetical protein [Deltaproteobacteria bacterium]
MTCGAEECQKKRHAKKCKQWHGLNPDTAASHYQDVVKPYRQLYPSYQRRQRLVVALRKIREELLCMAHRACRRLAALVSRGRQVVAQGAQEPVHVRAMTGKPLEDALAAAASLVGSVDELTALAGQLAVLGGTP